MRVYSKADTSVSVLLCLYICLLSFHACPLLSIQDMSLLIASLLFFLCSVSLRKNFGERKNTFPLPLPPTPLNLPVCYALNV